MPSGVPEVTWWEAFREGPLPFVGIGLVSFVALVSAFLALVLRSKRSATLVLAIVGVVLALASVSIGAMAMIVGRARTMSVVSVPGLSANDRMRLLEYGNATAAVPLKLAFTMAWLPLGLGVIALIRRPRAAPLAS